MFHGYRDPEQRNILTQGGRRLQHVVVTEHFTAPSP
jgi:hypothetical protein